MTNQNTATISTVGDRSSAIKVGAMTIIAGLFLVLAVGFAHPQVLHNAAHDSRHSLSFPCH
jgi:cobalt transporter subunit CbtB